jgi:colicin import membrane protein
MTQSSPHSPPIPSTLNSGKRKKWLPWIVGAASFVLGVAVGGVGPQDPTASPQYTELRADLQSEQQRTSQLTDEVEDARADIDAAVAAAESRLAEQTSALDQRSAELDQRAVDLSAQEVALRAAEQQATVPPPAAAPPPAPAPLPAPAAPEVTSVYYDNCTAARNAGAAPVRVGDPGYAGHLDRDGDGVGCE